MLNVNPWNILFTILNLLILYFGMRHFLYKPILGIMEKRKKLLDDERAMIEKEKDDALAMKLEAQRKLDSVENEAKVFMTNARNHAKDEADRITAEASFKARLMIENTKRECEEEKAKVRKDTESEIAKLAVMAARKLVTNAVLDESDTSVYDDFLKQAK